ncbi:MAG: hypothetical protein EOP76_20690 [Variovorax sp.]|nr:MAG: hypothetical protein EOP76_20690 [Variovorax sp.]
MYPDDFGYAVPFELLRGGEDTDVHVLWQALTSVGATLLAAEFPRAYIDPNRDVDDLDPDLLAGTWPAPLHPSEKTRLGIGLIWRDAGKNAMPPIYARKLPVAEVQNRIATYHAPYHAAIWAGRPSAGTACRSRCTGASTWTKSPAAGVRDSMRCKMR